MFRLTAKLWIQAVNKHDSVTLFGSWDKAISSALPCMPQVTCFLWLISFLQLPLLFCRAQQYEGMSTEKQETAIALLEGKNKFISNSCFCLLSSLSKDFEAILGKRYFSCFSWRQKINTTFFTLVITLLILIPILTCFQLVITVGKAIHKGREVGCDYIQHYVTSSLKAVLVGWNNQ